MNYLHLHKFLGRQIIPGRPWGGFPVKQENVCECPRNEQCLAQCLAKLGVVCHGGYYRMEPWEGGCVVSITLAQDTVSAICLSGCPFSLLPRLLNPFFGRSHSFFRATSWELTAHLHFDLLFASLWFVSHRQSDSYIFGRSLMGCTKYWQRNPQQHTNCKSFSQNFKLLCFCKTIFWKSSSSPPHLFKIVYLLSAICVRHHSRCWKYSHKQGGLGLRWAQVNINSVTSSSDKCYEEKRRGDRHDRELQRVICLKWETWR